MQWTKEVLVIALMLASVSPLPGGRGSVPTSAAAARERIEAAVDALLTRAESEQPVTQTAAEPRDLDVLLDSVARVESNFNPLALSPKGALGVYQFMPETAKRFGLRVGTVDDRIHPEKSRHAAARYLRFLHSRFDDWKLALAAYNAGEGRIQRAILRAGTRDFSRIAPLLPQETRDYVPKVLRAEPTRSRSILFAPFSLSP